MSKFFYQAQLNSLLEDEDNIVFFCDLVKVQLRSNPEDAKQTIEYVVSFCDENLLEDSKAWMLYYLSKYYFYTSMLEEASAVYDSARVIFEKNGNIKGIIYIYTGLVKIYLVVGKVHEARLLSGKCISLAKALGDDNIFVRALLNNALLLARLGEETVAFDVMKYVDTNYSYTLKDVRINDAYKLAHLSAIIADGQYEEALDMLETGDYDKIKSDIIPYDVNRHRAQICMKLGDFDKAMASIEKGLSETPFEQKSLMHCNLLMDYAKLMYFSEKINRAVDMLSTVLGYAREKSYYSLLIKSYDLMYLCFKKLGDCKTAIDYLNKSLAVKSELHKYNQPMDIPAWRSISDEDSNLPRLLHDKSEIVSSISSDIISEFEIGAMLKKINKRIRKLVPCDNLCVSMLDDDRNNVTVNELGHDIQINDKVVGFDLWKSLDKYCFMTGYPVLIGDFEREISKYKNLGFSLREDESFPYRSMISLPLIFGGEIIGVFTLKSKARNSYNSDNVSNLKLLAGFLVTAIKNGAKYKALEAVAIYDSLTGCYTRKVALERGENILEETRGTDSHLCVYMIDMDNLKHINDSLGHVCGDRILNKVAQIIFESMGKKDFVGRYGGDEFVLVSPYTTIEDGYELAKRIQEKVETACAKFCTGEISAVTVSIGVFNYYNSGVSFEEGLRFADYAMYQAKSQKKSSVFRLSL